MAQSNLSSADKTYLKLEEMLVLTELKPGVMYTETELAERLNVGRTPVREALQRLALEGLVIIIQRRGVQVTEVDVDTQLQLLEIRRVTQSFAARLAAQRASEHERKTMRAFADELEAGKDAGISSRSQALINVSQAFDLVVQASHNPYVNKTVGIVRAMSRRFWIYHLKRHDYAPAAQAYVRLLRAVAAGQPDEAAAASDALIDYLEAFARQKEDWT